MGNTDGERSILGGQPRPSSKEAQSLHPPKFLGPTTYAQTAHSLTENDEI